jgi:methyl-accepting chemotaxis protein
MPAKTHGERLDRLEEVVGLLAEGQLSLEKVVAELATETRRGFDQVAAQFEVIGKQMAETDERIREMARENTQRSRELDERISKMARENTRRSSEVDERIDKLVLAIGELIRNQKAPRA